MGKEEEREEKSGLLVSISSETEENQVGSRDPQPHWGPS